MLKFLKKLFNREEPVQFTIGAEGVAELQRMDPGNTWTKTIRRALTVYKYLMIKTKEGHEIILERRVPRGDSDDRIKLLL